MHRRIAPSHFLPVLAGLAGTLVPLGGSNAGEITSRPAGDRCATYGPGFAAVAGSDTCMRIGGRVRVEAGNGIMSPNTGWANDGLAPAGTSDQRRHLRLTETSGTAVDPFAR